MTLLGPPAQSCAPAFPTMHRPASAPRQLRRSPVRSRVLEGGSAAFSWSPWVPPDRSPELKMGTELM